MNKVPLRRYQQDLKTLHQSPRSMLTRQGPKHAVTQSQSPNGVRREELNSDIMVLMSKPQGRLEPLRVNRHILASSSDSQRTDDS